MSISEHKSSCWRKFEEMKKLMKVCKLIFDQALFIFMMLLHLYLFVVRTFHDYKRHLRTLQKIYTRKYQQLVFPMSCDVMDATVFPFSHRQHYIVRFFSKRIKIKVLKALKCKTMKRAQRITLPKKCTCSKLDIIILFEPHCHIQMCLVQ